MPFIPVVAKLNTSVFSVILSFRNHSINHVDLVLKKHVLSVLKTVVLNTVVETKIHCIQG